MRSLGIPVLAVTALLAAGCDAPGDGGSRPVPRVLYSGDLFRRDSELGYAPVPGRRVTARKVHGSSTVYEAVYTIDPHGARESPGPAGADPVLFFGDSFTFGDDVSDAQAYPAVFQAASRGRYRAINLSVTGYGPHHMLRQLEVGRELPALAGARPRRAFYFATRTHPARAAGRAPWDVFGPSYVLEADGRARYAGPFHGRLEGALLWLRQLARPGPPAEMTMRPQDMDLFVAVTLGAARLINERHRGALVVILGDQLYAEAAKLLADRGITCWRLGELVPGGLDEKSVIPHDGHPNASFHRRLGESLLRRMTAQEASR